MKKHIMITIFLVLFLTFLFCVHAMAASKGKCGNNLNWVLSDDGTLTISGKGPMKKYDWKADPQKESYFHGSTTAPWGTDISRVVIKNGVTSIGDYAFFGCWKLQSISIPNSVTQIGEEAFAYCDVLREIHISSIESWLLMNFKGSRSRPNYNDSCCLFFNDEEAESITIPPSLSSINSSAINNFSNVKSIAFSDDVSKIGIFSFYGCSSLTSIIIPDGVTTIDGLSFSGCSSLVNISIPNSVTTINDLYFPGCYNLANISIPNSVTTIDKLSFHGCTSLRSFLVPDNCIINTLSFVNCTNLLNVTIPTSVKRIGSINFKGCVNLKCITVPECVTSFDNYAFQDCLKLEKIAFFGEKTVFGESVIPESISNTLKIYCHMYSDADSWATQNKYRCIYFEDIDIDTARTIFLEPNFRLKGNYKKPIVFSVFPSAEDSSPIIWNSSNPSIISVDENGIITAHSAGKATITATIGNVSAKVIIDSYFEVSDFELSDTEVWLVAKTPIKLYVESFEPWGASSPITWSSSDPNLAIINKSGDVTTIKPGDVVITATTDSGITHSCLLHLCYPVTNIAFADEVLYVSLGSSTSLTANVTMRNQACINHLVDFSSSDEKIASIDSNGLLTTYSVGVITVTATSENGISSSCKIFVQ